MAKKDGFGPEMRMEMHEDAEESTYSLESQEGDDTDKNSEIISIPNGENQPSQDLQQDASYGFSPIPGRMASTPENQDQEALNQTKNEILSTLGKVQNLCEHTMAEVESLKGKWEKAEVETNSLKVKNL